MAAAAPPVFTVLNAMAVCGVDNVALFNGSTNAKQLAMNIFDDDFSTCMDKTFVELDKDFKTYSNLNVNQGQIRLLPAVKWNIKAFV